MPFLLKRTDFALNEFCDIQMAKQGATCFFRSESNFAIQFWSYD